MSDIAGKFGLSSSGPFGGRPAPIVMSGKILSPPHMKISGTGTVSVTAARYYITPFIVGRATTFAGVKFANIGAADNGKKVKIAFYNEAAAGGPGTLAKDFGEATLTGASAVRTLASSWSAAAGLYYGILAPESACDLAAMTPLLAITAAGYPPFNDQANMLHSFATEAFASNIQTANVGDYVAGTYANFPEATALTPTNTILTNAGSTFPTFGPYV